MAFIPRDSRKNLKKFAYADLGDIDVPDGRGILTPPGHRNNGKQLRQIAERTITPGDLAATIYRHMGVPLDTTYEDERGRPHYAIQNNGQPLAELV